MILMHPETNMCRVPGCYDVHWRDMCAWLWTHWDEFSYIELAQVARRAEPWA